MSEQTSVVPEVQTAEDICSLSLARRMAALLDRAPESLEKGDPLPRGWHVMMFNPPTRQSRLRLDGAAGLGFTMPDLGLPRLMMGGRRIDFTGDIIIGERVLRRSELVRVMHKEGRSGPFALVDVEHRLSQHADGMDLLVETVSYILRPESAGAEAEKVAAPGRANSITHAPGAAVRVLVPDEPMLFRYSAITDNPHRIHYDLAYASEIEGYSALVVNGSLPQMVLLEMFREHVGREPLAYESRNKEPLFCGGPITLSVAREDDCYALLAHDENGNLAIEASAQ